jgi:hypothetical protein
MLPHVDFETTGTVAPKEASAPARSLATLQRDATAPQVSVTGGIIEVRGLRARIRTTRVLTWLAPAAALLVLANAGAAKPPSLLMRHVARDITTTPGFQHATAVEPMIAAGPNGTLVTAFQVGRSRGRGAAAIGFSTSRDGGKTWRQGLFEPVARAGTTRLDVTDAVVAYDRAHRVWIVASIVDFANGSRTLEVHRSSNGTAWSGPYEVARGVIDHEAITCDRSTASRFRGRCYLAFTREDVGRLGVRTTANGGLTWSTEAVITSSLGHPNASFPVTRPNGRLVVLFREGGGAQPGGSQLVYSSVSSDDGGATFRTAARVATIKPYFPPHFRGVPTLVPSVAVDARGRLYAVWHSCRFRRGCAGNDLVLSQSSNGDHWSAPKRMPLDRASDHLIPGLAVAPPGRGTAVRLGLAYYTIANDHCRPAKCRITPYFVGSSNGGRTWSQPVRAHAPMLYSWLAESPADQAFVADNVSTTFIGTTAWSAYAVAARPAGGTLRATIAVARVRSGDLRRR